MSELEWAVRPLIEEWADVASFDAPGVGPGDTVPSEISPLAVPERARQVIDELGWETCVVAADEWAVAYALLFAADNPDRVAGLALGHPTLSWRHTGDDAPINGDVLAGFVTVSRASVATYARAVSQVTAGSYDDALAKQFMERIPQDMLGRYLDLIPQLDTLVEVEPVLRRLDKPLLIAEHRACLLWSTESFQAVVDRFPNAHTVSTDIKPNASPEFAGALREFCAAIDG